MVNFLPLSRTRSAESALMAVAFLAGGLPLRAADHSSPEAWKPVESTQSGLLLESPLDLSWFTTAEFEMVSATVGREKIRKTGSPAVMPLPPHGPMEAPGLTEARVKEYMGLVRRLFDEGKANPVSDVGLISTQEDVIRQPMYNHISVFSNEAVHVYLLVQRTAGNGGWGYFSIVQDRTTDPPTDYYAEVKGAEIRFEGTSCYKCHSSGPLAIHPARADLVSDPGLAAAISQHIADQPVSRMHFPAGGPVPDYGKPLALKACAKCHAEDGDRAPLFRVQAHPIRVLVDYGYMPPKHRLTPEELAELKAWLEAKP